MNLADIFFQEILFKEFDSKPIEIQEYEVNTLKEKYETYKNRLKKNKGSNAGAPKIYSDETIKSFAQRIEKIKTSEEFLRRKKKNEKDMTAYVIAVETALKDPIVEKLLIDEKWISSHKSLRKDEIKRLAKNFKQDVYRYNKNKTRT